MPGPTFSLERAFLRRDLGPIAGVDEAGRGPLAGPVAAAAVILDPRKIPKGLNDSKQLKPELRERLYEEILASALAVGVALVSAIEIDRINIRQATHAAMRRAVSGLAVAPAHVLVDGNDLPRDLPCSGETLIKGDARSASIAAASIVAKVTRDRMMQALCPAFPVYGFGRHMGYGTPDHLAAIALHGPSPYHRMSFSPLRQPEMRLA